MSDYYVRLPKLTELTRHQRIAIDEPNAVFISGLAGTGKSVCLMYRYIKRLKSIKIESVDDLESTSYKSPPHLPI